MKTFEDFPLLEKAAYFIFGVSLLILSPILFFLFSFMDFKAWLVKLIWR